jgi:hypothetical protein
MRIVEIDKYLGDYPKCLPRRCGLGQFLVGGFEPGI